MPGKYCDDYHTPHVHTLHIQAIYKHTVINFPASSQQIKCNSLYLRINVILYLSTKCKTLYKVRQVKVFVQSANCTFGEQLQNTNAPLII